MRCDQLVVRSPTRARPASIVSSSSAVRMPAAARTRACACEAATSWGSRRQSKGKLRCHCSKVRSRGSRKRPDHILVGCCELDNLSSPCLFFFVAKCECDSDCGNDAWAEANESLVFSDAISPAEILAPWSDV